MGITTQIIKSCLFVQLLLHQNGTVSEQGIVQVTDNRQPKDRSSFFPSVRAASMRAHRDEPCHYFVQNLATDIPPLLHGWK